MPGKDAQQAGNTRRRGASAAAALLGALCGTSTGWSAPPAQQPGAEQALTAIVSQRTAELALTVQATVTPSDRALEAAVAIKAGDYAKARGIAADVFARSRLQSWRFYPFNEFMGSVMRGDNSPMLERLNTWIAQEPNSGMGHLFRAMYYLNEGWTARGNDFASRVPAPLMDRFDQDMRRARADLEKSILLDSRNPFTYYALLDVVASGGQSADIERSFQAGIRAFPSYYPLYQRRLRSLAPKWGGSIGSMYDFVERYAGTAPENSAIKMLYLDLYASLLDDVALDCRETAGSARELCVNGLFWIESRHGLEEHMAAALNLYKVSDPIQFSTMVWPILETISCNRCIGSPKVGGAVLQLAASVMGSDNRIMDEPTHNSYMLDDITARVWAQMGNPANADKKFREALRDADRTSFADGAEKAGAIARILDHMAAFADDNNQFIDIIVFQEAANAVAGANHSDVPYRKCYAYYRMKYFAAAVKECTALIDGNDDYMQSHYWRGKAYEGLGDWDASIADFTPVADSASNWFRVGAALDMSYDFGQKADFAGQLASMNRYPYLFDPGLQPPHDLAVAFNNRCFAYMKLKQFNEALDDCTTSLKYDRIPDAYQKQQQLLRLLGTKSST